MNINCIICSDIFQATSEIYVTKCGHIFHHVCLIQWIERSKTCPQCRTKTTEKLINRIYFNILSSEGIVDDVTTLQNKVDASKLQLRLKEKELKDAQAGLDEAQKELASLKTDKLVMKEELEESNSIVVCLKEQVVYFKEKAKHVDKVESELKQVKDKTRMLEDMMKAITGTMEDVRDVVRDCHDAKTLSSIVTALKKEIMALEKKKNGYFMQLKQTENDLNKSKKEISELSQQNDMYKYQIQVYKQQESEKRSELNNADPNQAGSSKRTQVESPAPLIRNPRIHNLVAENLNSPSVSTKVKEIEDSDSPYFQLKSCSIPIMPLRGRLHGTGTSIFKSKVTVENPTIPKGGYDGFGGHNKPGEYDDVFPQPRAAVKRKNTITASKLKKLAKPNKKMSDFLEDWTSS